VIETWRRRFNDVRPHSSLEYRTLIEFRRNYDSLNLEADLK
jgi:transposase InsO family protein